LIFSPAHPFPGPGFGGGRRSHPLTPYNFTILEWFSGNCFTES